MTPLRRIGSLLAGLALSACSPEAHVGEQARAITNEIPGYVDLAFRHYQNVEIGRVAFASGVTVNDTQCSGSLIGPNLLLTAGHCGDLDRVLTLRLYRNDSVLDRTEEGFNCTVLLNTWPRSDLALLWCASRGGVVAPGDKFGYLDLDSSAVTNQTVYSIWANPLTNLEPNHFHMLYSAGNVTATNVVLWPDVYNLNGPANQPIGIALNTWSYPGASGSLNINAANHRVLVGPTTLAGDTDPAGVPYRAALSTSSYLRQATVETAANTPPYYVSGLKAQAIAALGISYSDGFYGLLDKDGDGLFDLQEALERTRGENNRAVYDLGFTSPRKNAMWDSAAYIDKQNAQVPIQTWGPTQLLSHSRLNLKPNTTYRVAVESSWTQLTSSTPLQISFIKNGVVQASANVTASYGGVQSAMVSLRTGSVPPDLQVWTTGLATGVLRSLTLLEEGAPMSFDFADERSLWIDANGARAPMLPEGISASTYPVDFAGLVTVATTGTVYTLQSRRMAVPTQGAQQICFAARLRGISSTTNTGSFRLGTGAKTTAVSLTFTPSSQWQTFCTTPFRVTTGDTGLNFGVNRISGAEYASYLVDDVRIQPTLSCVNRCGGWADGCWCDSLCASYGDCCPDKVNLCGS